MGKYYNAFNRIYVLAHWKSGQLLSLDSKIRVIAAIELAKYNKDAILYFVGGAMSNKLESTAQRMSNYFKVAGKLQNKIVVLDQSNNTTANIKEILNSLNSEPLNKPELPVIVSNEYHIDRIKQILKYFNPNIEVLSAEDFLKDRGFVEKYKRSFGYKLKKIKEKLMRIYLKIDPEEILVEKVLKNYRRL